MYWSWRIGVMKLYTLEICGILAKQADIFCKGAAIKSPSIELDIVSLSTFFCFSTSSFDQTSRIKCPLPSKSNHGSFSFPIVNCWLGIFPAILQFHTSYRFRKLRWQLWPGFRVFRFSGGRPMGEILTRNSVRIIIIEVRNFPWYVADCIDVSPFILTRCKGV